MVGNLACLIDEYINSSKSRSLCKLAKSAGVPYSTIRRIVQKEVGSVGMETVIAILRVFKKSGEILDFVDKHYPQSAKMFRDYTSKLSSEQFATQELCEIMSDYSSWLLTVLAEKEEGTSFEELEFYVGKKSAQNTIKKIETLDLIEYRNGKIHLKDKDYVLSGNAETQLKVIKHICDTYDQEKKSEPGHMLVNLTKEWNDEGLSFVRETLKEAAIKIIEASKESRFRGNKICVFGIVSACLNAVEG